MFSLEEKVRPPILANPRPRDAFGIGLLLALALILVPAWGAGRLEFRSCVSGQMTSFYLLPALAFLLALRRGAIDLSVWAVAAMGGLVAAELISRGVDPMWAFAASLAGGLLLGAFNGAMVAWVRAPGVLVTLGVAFAITWVLQGIFPVRTVRIPERAFDDWLFRPGVSLLLIERLMVGGVYALTMLVWLAVEIAGRRGAELPRRWKLFACMSASGAIAGIAGATWLLGAGATPVPRLPVGDLRIPAAVVLAGGAFFAGRGRSLLAGVCLPPALLLATIWRQEVWRLLWEGYELQMVLLTGMVITAHLAAAEAVSLRWTGRRWLPITSLTPVVLGILLIAAGAAVADLNLQLLLHVTGLGAWMVGAILLLIVKRLRDSTGARGD